MNSKSRLRTYAMTIKPVGATCNLRCEYCYYLDKRRESVRADSKMSAGVLEAATGQIIAMHGRDAVVEFAWHGGEPLLAGVEFYREAIRLQKRYGRGRQLQNTIQTNGTLLDKEWCEFFKENNFIVGISLDGPEALHNRYRKGPGGASFEAAFCGLQLLRKYDVSYNVLCTVNRYNSEHPLEVYRFLKRWTEYIQFLPVVEFESTQYEKERGQVFATPPGIHSPFMKHPLISFSVQAKEYGNFMKTTYREWVQADHKRF